MKYLIAFFGATAVLLGALGAHTLAPFMEDSALNSFKTGVLYQLVHTVALFASLKSSVPNWTRYSWCIGIILFSFSIYLLSTDDLLGLNLSFLGPVTPLGGLAFVAGWVGVAFDNRL
jgi:uncharacterized membrane protein YgdD (TMEM256/DUF423 family)